MPRATWKGPTWDPKAQGLQVARSATLLPQWVGLRLQVHNGKTMQTLLVEDSMIGHKAGEFCTTRRLPVHRTKRK